MKSFFYTIITMFILLLNGCADAGKSQTVPANTRVYFDVSDVKADLGGKITQYNWELTGEEASTYNIYIFENGTNNASFIAPNVSKETKFTFKLTSIESYKCSSELDSSCKHHKSIDRVKITVTPSSNGDSNNSITVPNNTSNTITLSGKVKTLNNIALSGAVVTISGKKITTRSDGTYSINNLNVNSRTIIHVTHPDYFDNTRIVLVNQNGTYNQDIYLSKINNSISFPAQEGGNIISNNASINFEAGDYRDTKGKKYIDTVKVSMNYYNFKQSSDSNAFIGSYETTNGSTQSALLPHAFINMSLVDSTGNILKINNDTVVKISFPATDAGSSDETIPLWFYSKKLGYWLKEGTATRINNKYIAQVKHVDSWGLFTQTTKGSIQVCVVDGDNKALSGVNIRINGSKWSSNLIQTNSEGIAIINTIRTDIPLTITANKLLDGKQVTSNYYKQITLHEGENINLSDCIILKGQTTTKENNNTN